MTRTGGAWIPDGRAKTILADCHASLDALDGLPIDLYLIHAPDPRTSWRTSVRALGGLLSSGDVRNVGLANVNRQQLEQALELVDITAIQVALSAFDDSAVRAGLVDYCAARGIAVIAHSPLGGPRRAGKLARHPALVDVGRTCGASPSEVALAWLLGTSPSIVAIPGARRPETARSAARSAAITLDASDGAGLAATFGWRSHPLPPPAKSTDDAEVTVIMGIPGAGKSRIAEEYVARGYLRLNRDERGGSLRDLAGELDAALSTGKRRVVLDNTYLTRAARSHVIETAGRHRIASRCVWIDTPLAQAQRNIVERVLERFGALPEPGELRVLARRAAGILMPTSQMRALRELEPPTVDEGFASVDQRRFARSEPSVRGLTAGVFVAADAMSAPGWNDAIAHGTNGVRHLVFDWNADGSSSVLDDAIARLSAEIDGQVTGALCRHAAGPPSCWCRPPLPGLLLAFSRAHNVDLARSILIGAGPAHRTLASTLDMDYVAV